jgi:steroid delta-isomerase-like uncharacterized protein
MSEMENRRLIEEAFSALNAHDPDRYAKIVDDSYVLESEAFPAPLRGREGVKQFIAMYVKAFPDFHYEIEQMIASGDYVVSRWRITGTHKGEFDGIPATNRRFSTRGCTVSEIRNSRIVKASVYYDQLVVLQQLGVAAGKPTRAAS